MSTFYNFYFRQPDQVMSPLDAILTDLDMPFKTSLNKKGVLMYDLGSTYGIYIYLMENKPIKARVEQKNFSFNRLWSIDVNGHFEDVAFMRKNILRLMVWLIEKGQTDQAAVVFNGESLHLLFDKEQGMVIDSACGFNETEILQELKEINYEIGHLGLDALDIQES